MPTLPSDIPGSSVEMRIGELIAEVRAVKHNQANDSQKLDALGSIASAQTEMLRRMERFEKEQERHNFRLEVLETDKHRREGAIGLVSWLSEHWPFTIFAAMLTALTLWASGKLHP